MTEEHSGLNDAAVVYIIEFWMKLKRFSVALLGRSHCEKNDDHD